MLAYGLDLPVPGSTDLTGDPRLTWHSVDLRRQRAAPPGRTAVELGPNEAVLRVRDDLTLTVRRVGTAVVLAAESDVPDARLVHPLAAFVGAVVAGWTGRCAFHAASVELHGRAWVLLAAPDGGKSTLAAVLDARGHRVLADDLTVVDGSTVLAGPRSCDLRAGAAAELGRGGLVELGGRDRERWREALRAAPCEAPLGGFVSLTWGERLSCVRVPLERRLALLAAHDALGQGPGRPTDFLDLLGAPTLELTRPQEWTALEPAVELLERVTAP